MDLSNLVDFPGIIEKTFTDGGFARIDMCGDTDVTHSIILGHSRRTIQAETNAESPQAIQTRWLISLRYVAVRGLSGTIRWARLPAMRASYSLLAVILAAPLSLAGQARAEDPGQAPDFAAAKVHYTNAENAANAGDWAVATKEYGIAYEITRDPVLFFKLGNAYLKSNDCSRAVDYFQRYLNEANPSQEFRDDASLRIKTCQGSSGLPTTATRGEETKDSSSLKSTHTAEVIVPVNNSSATEQGRDEESVGGWAPDDLGDQPVFLDEATTWQSTAAWGSVAVSVALLSAGTVLGLSAKSREEDIDNLISYRDPNGEAAAFEGNVSQRHQELIDEGNKLNKMALVTFGLAGAGVVTAAVFFFLDPGSDAPEDALTILPNVSGDSFGVKTGWSF